MVGISPIFKSSIKFTKEGKHAFLKLDSVRSICIDTSHTVSKILFSQAFLSGDDVGKFLITKLYSQESLDLIHYFKIIDSFDKMDKFAGVFSPQALYRNTYQYCHFDWKNKKLFVIDEKEHEKVKGYFQVYANQQLKTQTVFSLQNLAFQGLKSNSLYCVNVQIKSGQNIPFIIHTGTYRSRMIEGLKPTYESANGEVVLNKLKCSLKNVQFISKGQMANWVNYKLENERNIQGVLGLEFFLENKINILLPCKGNPNPILITK